MIKYACELEKGDKVSGNKGLMVVEKVESKMFDNYCTIYFENGKTLKTFQDKKIAIV